MANEIKVILDHYKFKLLKYIRPLTVHAESIFNDKVWKEVQKFVRSGRKAIWFVLTPVNYEYAIAECGFKGSKKQYEKIILERYKWLQEHGQEIQLHLHTIRFPEMFLTRRALIEEHEKKIKNAIRWLRVNGFDVDKITFGWWSYNEDSERIAGKYGLKTVRELDYHSFHDFDLLRSKI